MPQTARPAPAPRPMAALNRLTAPSRPAIRRASALSALAAALWMVQAALVAAGLARAIAAAPIAALPSDTALVAGFVLLGLIRAALNWQAEALAFTAGETLVAALRGDLITTETRRRPRSPAPFAPGALAALALEKADLILPYLTRYAPAQARVMVMPLLILALAVSQSWAVALIFVMTGPLVPVFMALVGWAAQAASERQMVEMGSLGDLLVERLAALADLRLLGATEPAVADFATRADSLRARTMAVLRIAFLSSTVLELLAAIGVAMVAVWVGFSLLGQLGWGTWGAPLTPFAGIWLLLMAPDFYQPLRDLSAAWHDRAGALAVAGEIATWQAAPADPMPGRPAAPGQVLSWQGLRLPGGAAIPDVTLRPGQMLAVTGASGAGKTTLLGILAGQEPAGAGQIAGHGGAIGWVPQKVHFLDASVARNITLTRGDDPAPALEAAHIAGPVAALPQGSATRLGETGTGLSGGEARRVTLARALHSGAALILADEPTADLDAETAAAVIDSLLTARAAGHLMVVASHDPALIGAADQVITLGGGP